MKLYDVYRKDYQIGYAIKVNSYPMPYKQARAFMLNTRPRYKHLGNELRVATPV